MELFLTTVLLLTVAATNSCFKTTDADHITLMSHVFPGELKWFPATSCVVPTSTNLVSHFKAANLTLRNRDNTFQRSSLIYLAIILTATSSDIEANPGPSDSSTNIGQVSSYPCGLCNREVTWDDKALRCDTRDIWFHTQCENVRDTVYEALGNSSCSWYCTHCGSPNFSLRIFDSSVLNLSNSFSPVSSLVDSDTSSCISATSPGPPIHTSSPNKGKKKPRTPVKPLRVLNLNCRSIKNKKEQFLNVVDSASPDLIFGTESWLTPEVNDNEIFPPGFEIYRKDRTSTTGGRVFLAINSDYVSSCEPELDSNCELVWAKLQIAGQKTLHLGSYYRPNASDSDSLKQLQGSLDKLGHNTDVILAGDMNFPGWDWPNKCLKTTACNAALHLQFGNLLDDHNLEQIVEEPTRGNNILDLICRNAPSKVTYHPWH